MKITERRAVCQQQLSSCSFAVTVVVALIVLFLTSLYCRFDHFSIRIAESARHLLNA